VGNRFPILVDLNLTIRHVALVVELKDYDEDDRRWPDVPRKVCPMSPEKVDISL
jgi:hypothetical protein